MIGPVGARGPVGPVGPAGRIGPQGDPHLRAKIAAAWKADMERKSRNAKLTKARQTDYQKVIGLYGKFVLILSASVVLITAITVFR